MAEFANQQKALISIVEKVTAPAQSATSPSQSSSVTTNLALIQPFENFDSSKEPFKYYKQRFENYLKLKNTWTNKLQCAQLLLNSVGSSIYNTLAALVAPRIPTDLSYDDLITTLETHLCPQRNVMVAQHQFLSTYQLENQSVTEYVTTLRRIAIDCDFKSPCDCNQSIVNIFLRAQFVRGLRENAIREQILQSDENDFDAIIKKALALEASKADSREISQRNLDVSTDDINRISRTRSPSQTSRRRINANRSHSSFRSYNQSRNQKIDFAKLGLQDRCIRCGRDNHISKDCKTNPDRLKCSFCSKTGHIKSVCIKAILDSQKSSDNNNSTHRVKYDEYSSSDDALSQYSVSHVIDIFQHKKMSTADLGKYFVTVELEGQSQMFEVDSGAGFSFIPRDQFRSLKLSTPLESSTVAFRSYTGDIFRPDGYVNVNVRYKGKTSTEQLYVVPEIMTLS